ncbi:MAG: TIGR04076 family protein [Dactylosporangium sp.]|nr:TIGR04076 family protein [Dactylosporangium sp.]
MTTYPSGASEHACKITVLRKDFNEDFYDQYPYEHRGPCGVHEVGQEFVTTNVWEPPAGLCPWAWADLRPIIQRIGSGSSTIMVSCCTDGLRPVYFRCEPAGSGATSSCAPRCE